MHDNMILEHLDIDKYAQEGGVGIHRVLLACTAELLNEPQKKYVPTALIFNKDRDDYWNDNFLVHTWTGDHNYRNAPKHIKDAWFKAEQYEINQLNQHDVYDEVDLPLGRKAVKY